MMPVGSSVGPVLEEAVENGEPDTQAAARTPMDPATIEKIFAATAAETR